MASYKNGSGKTYEAFVNSKNKQTEKVDYNAFNYGALNGQKVRSANDNVKLAKYIAKLTNHAIKDTTKLNRIIYNRV